MSGDLLSVGIGSLSHFCVTTKIIFRIAPNKLCIRQMQATTMLLRTAAQRTQLPSNHAMRAFASKNIIPGVSVQKAEHALRPLKVDSHGVDIMHDSLW